MTLSAGADMDSAILRQEMSSRLLASISTSCTSNRTSTIAPVTGYLQNMFGKQKEENSKRGKIDTQRSEEPTHLSRVFDVSIKPS